MTPSARACRAIARSVFADVLRLVIMPSGCLVFAVYAVAGEPAAGAASAAVGLLAGASASCASLSWLLWRDDVARRGGR